MNTCDNIAIPILALLIVIFIAIAFFIPIQIWRIYIHPSVEVFVDQKLIYKGSDVCVDIKSSGFNTTVKTSKYLCLMPVKSYTSKDVTVNTVE